jgi:putative flippase GtrA
MHRTTQQARRYTVVAVMGVGVDLAVLWLLADVLGMWVMAAGIIAKGVVFVHNFTLHKAWTFKGGA